MKKITKKVISVILAITIALTTVLATVAASNECPIDIEITTNKEEYGTLGKAKFVVEVTNKSNQTVENVSAEAVFDELDPFGFGSEISAEDSALEPGETLRFEFKASLDAKKMELNFIQRILLKILRCFHGDICGFPDEDFDDGRAMTSNTHKVTFGKYEVEQLVEVWYEGESTENSEDEDYCDVKYSLAITDFIENKDEFKATRVKVGEVLARPDDPVAPVGYFDGWYTSAKCDVEFDFNQPINADTIIYAKWDVDKTDSDKDGLYDDFELYLKTDPTKYDTDDDGLNDYYELLSNTDPLVKDSDNDSISDYDEDFDEDTLSNGEEMVMGTQPNYKDSDGDGLSDAEESKIHNTNPHIEDTDADGANDGWEIENGFDPLVYNDSFLVEEESLAISDTNPVSAGVQIELAGEDTDTVTVTPVDYSDNTFISESIPGYLGQAYNFETTSNFESAELIFTYDTSLGEIGESFQPRIYYFNEQKNVFEELPDQTVTKGMVKAKVEHFSTYILLNKVEFDKVWETEIAPPLSSGDSNENDALDIVFVIDYSHSMSWNDPNGLRKHVTKEFISKLRDGKDKAAVVSFIKVPSVVCNLTDNKEQLYTAVDGIVDNDGYGTNAGTNGSNAINSALNVLDTSSASNKFIIFLTDGEDTYTSYSYSSLTTKAIEKDITIYSIGLGTADEALLKSIAEPTGGKYYKASADMDLTEIYDKIEEETIDLTADINNDLIPDYYNDRILSGKLVLNNGSSEFSGFDFNYDRNGNESNDYDGDGLLNGEELIVYFDEDTKRVYMYMASDPTTMYSDTDDADDFVESKNGTNPLKFDHYTNYDVNALKNDDLYYYESYVENVYDDSIIYQIDSAFLSVITGSFNPVGQCREFLVDYLDEYGETYTDVDEMALKIERDTWLENLDRLLSFIDDHLDIIEKAHTIKDDIKNLMSVVRGYQINPEEIAKIYYEIIEVISIHTSDFDAIIIKEPVLIEETITAIKKSPIDDFDTKGLGLSIGFDLIGGSLDVMNTFSSFSKVKANYNILNQNIDIIERMSKYGSRLAVCEAAEDVINAMGEGFGKEVAKAVGTDLGEMTLNMAISIASCNPYVAAVTFAIDMINLFTGLSATLEREYKMLFYNTMADSIEELISLSSNYSGSYTIYDNGGNLERYLIHLAQVRILGEILYKDFYTHGATSWFVDKSAVTKNIENNIEYIKGIAENLDIILSPKL